MLVNRGHTKKIVIMALLIAMEFILTRLLSVSIAPWARLSLGFAPIAVMAMLYGPIAAGIGAAASDFLGATLLPTGFFFPGLTLSAFLTGLTYGLFLRKQPIKLWRICVAALIVTVVINLVIDTFWLSIIFREGVIVLLPARVVRTLLLFPLQVVGIRFLAGERFRHVFPNIGRTG